MNKGGGTEVAQNGSRGDAGEHLTEFQGIWPPTQLSAIVQLTWPNYYGLGQLLACGGEKPVEVTE